MTTPTRRPSGPLIGVLLLAARAAAVEPNAAVERGQVIYERGVGRGGHGIRARLGSGTTEVTADSVPCVGCHGADGHGRTEGGIAVPPITWEALRRPTRADGRRLPPYDSTLVVRAAAEGLDSSGQPLSPAMPRYRLTPVEAVDLVAYLRRIGTRTDPGVQSDRLVLGTIVSTAPGRAEASRHRAQVLAAALDEIGTPGGIFGRRLALRVVEVGEGAQALRRGLVRLIDTEQVFAIVGADLVDADATALQPVLAAGVPLIAPYTLAPPLPPEDGPTFYLLPGFAAQARALVEAVAACDRAAADHVQIVAGGEAGEARLVDSIAATLAQAAVHTTRHAPGDGWTTEAVAAMRAGGDSVLVLGSGVAALDLARAVEPTSWRPWILLLGPLLGDELPPFPAAVRARTLLAFPTLSVDRTEAGRSRFAAFAERHGLSPQPDTASAWMFVAADLVAEGLKRAGRRLGRTALVAGVEAVDGLESGLLPRLSFGPRQHVGSRLVHVVGDGAKCADARAEPRAPGPAGP